MVQARLSFEERERTAGALVALWPPWPQPPAPARACRAGRRTCMAHTVVGDSVLPGIMGGGRPSSRLSRRRLRCTPAAAAASSATARASGPASASAIIWWPRSEGWVLRRAQAMGARGGRPQGASTARGRRYAGACWRTAPAACR